MTLTLYTVVALLACCAQLAAVLAAPVDDSRTATILRSEQDVGIDSYKFAFETSDGTQRDEEGQIKNAGTETEALSVRGSISWVAPDGQTYTLTFVADENGYQPEAVHLPK